MGVCVRGELERVYVWQRNVRVECVCMCVYGREMCVCTKRVHVHGGETKRGSAQNSTANDPILHCIID